MASINQLVQYDSIANKFKAANATDTIPPGAVPLASAAGNALSQAYAEVVHTLLQRSGQIDRRGRFPHAALLIDKCQNLRHTHFTPLRPHFAFYYNVLLLKMQEVM